MKFNEIKDLCEAIDYEHLLSVEDTVWAIGEDYIYWIRTDYAEGEVYVYSAHLTEGFERQEDYLICNGDTECGYWMTFVFPLGDEIPYSRFEDKYEDYI